MTDGSDPQLALGLFPALRDADDLLRRLRALGLQRITRLRLTDNRRIMVSFQGADLRVHRGYLAAPEPVLAAIVTLVEGRLRRDRRAARTTILSFPVAITRRATRRERPHPDDASLAERLAHAHAELNVSRFGGALRPIDIRVSRRMHRLLGHFGPGRDTQPPEIAISRRHIRRHGWEAAIETLVHEMVHQWQHESGLPLDHRAGFRRKAIEVGIEPRAKRGAG